MSLRMDSKLVANLGTWRTFLRMRVRWRFPMLAMIIRDLSVVTIFLLLGQGEYVEKISDELTMCSISWILDLKVEKIVIWGIYFRKKGNSLECARDHEARDGCTFSTSSRMRWLCSSGPVLLGCATVTWAWATPGLLSLSSSFLILWYAMKLSGSLLSVACLSAVGTPLDIPMLMSLTLWLSN